MNLAMGLGMKKDIVHVIDFGLSKSYINSKTKKHIPFNEKKRMVGTACFVSINAHIGYEQSRRDDLEGLGYTLIYLVKGLPWKRLKAVDEKDLRKKIHKQKSTISVEELCKGLIEPFGDYLRYCKTLLFQDKPDYNYLKKLFRTHFLKLCPNNNFVFNWSHLKKDKSIKALEEEKKVEISNKAIDESGSKEIKAEENEKLSNELVEQNIISTKELDDEIPEENNFNEKAKVPEFELTKNSPFTRVHKIMTLRVNNPRPILSISKFNSIPADNNELL